MKKSILKLSREIASDYQSFCFNRRQKEIMNSEIDDSKSMHGLLLVLAEEGNPNPIDFLNWIDSKIPYGYEIAVNADSELYLKDIDN